MNLKPILMLSSALAMAACTTTPADEDVASTGAAPAEVALAATTNTATTASANWAENLPPAQQPRDFGAWGYDTSAMDSSVNPGDDFDSFASGAWKARTEIPSDQSSAGVSWDIYKVTEGQLRTIIMDAPADSQLGALFQSFMDEDRVNALGLEPLRPRLDAIRAAADKSAFSRLMGETAGTFGGSLAGMFPYADPNEPTVSSLFVGAGGLGLPEKDYYFDDRFAKERNAYVAYLTRIFTQAGQADPAAAAATVMGFETEIARRYWEVADRRDFAKINNPMSLAELGEYAPGIDWPALLAGAGVATSRDIIVMDNTAVRDIAALYAETPLDTLKLWQIARTVDQASPYLADEFVQSRFAFQKVLSGTNELRPRWTRGVQLIDGSLGELLGATYVAKHFPPAAKAKMESMVANLKDAMAVRINTNDWMAPETRTAALEKLAKMDVMVGYPAKFRDYSALELSADDLLGNVARVNLNEWAYQRDKIDQPVDKGLWGMTPQTLNAYNGAFENKIVFPAGILQPPMFSMSADDAVNYGAIGAVIGHEITHGFDDQGRKIDAEGKLRDWWTEGDGKRFEAKAADLGKQYDKFEAAPGHFIKGQQTMGENIADLAGLRVSLDAYRASLGGKEAPVIDGMTGEQRFFLAFAQAWQRKARDEAVIQQVTTGVHSPARFRVLGPLRNIDAWYDAFGITEGSTMYLPPEKRVQIW
ncbi:M13 family metallopeptidase [Altererythrobacter arenosus]|uniref:M13 family metallopeptidase n=1 Tax=Altererythrobacter arenosus TaxID=3032592 RepID=A0ABY8FNW2_9SPHN|nr:M13 family metallopeptidase [Altererythrobacter sp. CAU 1644]WFL76703.1 M13 family metallopeptidase [Altererythrobacter sp. CAU 1644]